MTSQHRATREVFPPDGSDKPPPMAQMIRTVSPGSRGWASVCGLADLLEHGIRAAHLELAGTLDVELLHHAVLRQEREALHADAHAAPGQIEF